MSLEEVIRIIRDEGALGIILVALFGLPILAVQWISLFEALAIPPAVGLGLLILIVVPLILWLLSKRKVSARNTVARDKILAYLDSRSFRMMSFERVRQNLDTRYSNEFLEALIDEFPETFRKAKLKGNKIGLARLNQEEEADPAP